MTKTYLQMFVSNTPKFIVSPINSLAKNKIERIRLHKLQWKKVAYCIAVFEICLQIWRRLSGENSMQIRCAFVDCAFV